MVGDLTSPPMTAYRVIVPDQTWRLVEYQQENLPGIAAINEQLAAFEPKIVFAWHLSCVLRFEDLVGNGMPSRAECQVIEPFCDVLDSTFKGDDPEKPNALFLARITWNGTRELVYRVYQPEPIHQALTQFIEAEFHPRHFDYRIAHDPDWKLAEWHLTAGIHKT